MQIFFRWAVSKLIFLAGPAIADQSRRTAHLSSVADAAIEASQDSKGSTDLFRRAKLADALMSGGTAARAKVALVKAGSLLGPVTNFSDKISGEEIVEKLAQLGSVADDWSAVRYRCCAQYQGRVARQTWDKQGSRRRFFRRLNVRPSPPEPLVEFYVGTSPNVASSALGPSRDRDGAQWLEERRTRPCVWRKNCLTDYGSCRSMVK